MSGGEVDLTLVYPSRDADQWSAVGAKKVIAACEATLRSHNRVLCYRAPGAIGAENRGTYQTHEYGEQLRSVVVDAHSQGLEVYPCVLVAEAGVWMGSRRGPSPSRMRIGSIPGFAMAHPEYLSRTQDGRSWMHWDIDEQVLGYDIGYMGLAYREVREYEISAFVEFVTDHDVDGVQLEFLPVLVEGQEVWPLGYDGPAIKAFVESHGVDPREIDTADEDWTRLRAGFYTQFLRELTEELATLGRKVEVSVAASGVWAAPETAYKLMVDWPAWVEEGLIDAIHPQFWVVDPHYPLSYPNSEIRSWHVTTGRIEYEISKVKEVVGDRCLIYGTVLCANGGGSAPFPELGHRIVDSARAMTAAGADGVSVFADEYVMSLDEYWTNLLRISSGSF